MSSRYVVVSLAGLLLEAGLAPTLWGAEPPEPADGRVALVLQTGHGDIGTVGLATFSPDGKRVLTATGNFGDISACLWDLASGLLVRRFEGREQRRSGRTRVIALGFTPDGRTVMVARTDRIHLLEVATGKEVRQLQSLLSFRIAALSSDGKLVAGVDILGRFQLWDRRTGKLLWTTKGRGEPVSLTFSKDSTRLVSADFVNLVSEETDRLTAEEKAANPKNYVRVWDAATGKELAHFPEVGRGETPAFLPDGNVVFGGYPGRIGGWGMGAVRIWDYRSGKVVRRWDRQGPKCAVSADGTRLATAGYENSKKGAVACLRVWDVRSGKDLYRLGEGKVNSLETLCFSADGKYLLAGTNSGVQVWDAATGQELRRLRGHVMSIYRLALAPDNAIAFEGHDLRLWDPARGRFTTWETDRTLYECAFSPDGKLLAGAPTRQPGIVLVYDRASGQQVHRLRGPSGAVSRVVFSPDSKYLLAGGHEKTKEPRSRKPHAAYLWSLESGREVARLGGHEGYVTTAVFSHDGRRVVTAGSDDPFRIWDWKNQKVLSELKRRGPQRYGQAAFTPDGKWLLLQITPRSYLATTKDLKTKFGYDPGFLVVWDLARGAVSRASSVDLDVASFAPGADSRTAYLGCKDGTIRAWDTQAKRRPPSRDPAAEREALKVEAPVVASHTLEVTSLHVSRDGRFLLSQGFDGVISWTALEKRQEVCRFVHSREGSVVFTPDHYYLASKAGLRGVAFRVGEHAYPFDQFDLRLNRPDKVLERIGLAPPELVAAYRRAHDRRLARMGLTEEKLSPDFHLPEVTILSRVPLATAEKRLTFDVRAKDSKYRLDRLTVSVNGVPDAAAGIDLRSEKTRGRQQKLSVELSAGKNVIRVAALNEQGAGSLEQTVEIECKPGKESKPNLYVVAVGVSRYANKRFDLTYADKDARDLAAYFSSRKGASFGAVKALTILNKDATRENILAARKLLERAGVNDQVVLFFAGHGLLDRRLDYYFATPDIDFKDPARRGLSYRDIEGLLDGLRARKKLLLVDTCHAGEADKDDLGPAKVVKVAEGKVRSRSFRGLDFVPAVRPAAVAARQLERETFANLRRGTGAVVIASSGAAECALESDTWSNGVFTYAVLAGLKDRRAARTKGQPVRVSELREFVTAEVQRLTGGRQTPAARAENIDFNFPVD